MSGPRGVIASACGVQHGFTLVELVIALLVLLLLSGVTVPIMLDRVQDERDLRAGRELARIAAAFHAFRADTGAWPTFDGTGGIRTARHDFTGYDCLFENRRRHSGWNGPYLTGGVRRGPRTVAAVADRGWLDPWGRPYHVFQLSAGRTTSGAIVLVCAGRNGAVQTDAASARAGRPRGDDLVLVVTERL